MTLQDYVGVIVRRKWVVVLAVLVSALGAFALTAVRTPVYSASAEVLIQPRGADGLFEDRITNLNDRGIQTEIQVIEGQTVRQRVADDLGLEALPPASNASGVGDTDVISVSIPSTNAANAQTLANAYAQAYIDVRREQSVAELLAASSEVQNAIDDLQDQIDGLSDDDPRRASLLTQASNFGTTLDQLRVDAALRTGGATIIRSADLPTDPVEPTPLRTTTLAVVVGLLIGLGAAFLIDYLDDKVRSVDELESVTARPILAEVPVDPPPSNLPIAVSHPDHASVEAYRGLRANLQFLALDRKLKVVQVTSSLAGEGKTTTATNLATVLARAGNRVAIVDADLRRPRVHEVFGLHPTPGLTDVLLGATPKSTVQTADLRAGDRMAVYTAGVIPSNPSEMLSGQRLRRLLEQMGEHYDYVIVDSAPILPVSDSIALSAAVDGVIVVAHAGRVTTSNVQDTLERLDRVAAPILGIVLNQASDATKDVYSYGGYAAAPSKSKAPAGGVIDDSTNENLFSDP